MPASGVAQLMFNSTPSFSKGSVSSFGPEEVAPPTPKSWFNDPFALLDSMGLGYRSAPSTLSFETLRAMAERNVVVSSIIQTRINQCSAFCQPQRNKYSVGYKLFPRNRDRKLSRSEREEMFNLEMFMLNMGLDRNPDRDTLETFVKKVVRDRLRYDQVCAEKVPRRNGKPYSVMAVDASTIRIASPKSKKGTPMTPRESRHEPKYVQVVDGTIVNQYTRREMIFRIANPRTEIQTFGYGYSELEMLINTITSHLWAEEWNRKVFSNGATVKGIINFKGNVAPNQLEAFRRQWLTQVSGVTNSWRTPIMNSDELQWVPLQPSNTDMGYQQWLEYLIKVACAVYLIDPAEINFDTRGGVGSQPMFMSSNEAQQKVSKDRGLQPLVRFVQTLINEDILWEIDPNYELVFLGLDSKTEAEAIELRMKELQSYKTLNDVRREADDLPPVPGGDVVLNPVYVGLMQGQQQFKLNKDMQQAAQAQPGQPGQAQQGQAPVGKPGGAQEMFPTVVGPAHAAGASEKMLSSKLAADAGITVPKKDDKEGKGDDDSHSVHEVEDVWEDTVRASLVNDLVLSDSFETLE